MTGARAVVAVDGAFECLLGALVLAGAASGRLRAGDFGGLPAVGLLAVGAALVVVGVALGGASAASSLSPRIVRVIAVGNVASAGALVVCAAAAGFSATAWVLTGVTSAALVALSCGELRAYRAVPARSAATYHSSSGSNIA